MSGTSIDGSTFDEIDLATDSDTTLLLSIVPELPDLTLTNAVIEADATLHALTINGAATVLGLSAELLVTADWDDADMDRSPTITFGAKLPGFDIDVINDAWTEIGGVLPSFTSGWATIASTPHTLTLGNLPPSAEAFYGADADGLELGTGLAFRGELDVTVWTALANALQSLSIDASAIVIEGEVGSPGLLFDNANADKSSLSLSATVSGTNLPQWMTASSTTVELAFDNAEPVISLGHQMSTDFGGATNSFVASFEFDPGAYSGSTVAATFAVDGAVNAPFGADFLTISNLQLEVTADLSLSPVPFDATLTADVTLPDSTTIGLTIGVVVDGSAVSGDFSLDGSVSLGNVLGLFQPLLGGGFDASAFATSPEITIDQIGFAFASGTTSDYFDLTASATINSLSVDLLVSGSETSAGNEVLVGIDVTQVDSGCGCILLGTVLDLPVGSFAADLELPELHLAIPLQATTLTAADLRTPTREFFEAVYGTLPSTIELDAGLNLSGRLPLDPLGTTVREALGYAAGDEVVLEGSLGVTLDTFAGGDLSLTGFSAEATLPTVSGGLLPSWVALTSGWTIGVDYTPGSPGVAELTVDVDLEVDLPGEPAMPGSISGVITKSGSDISISVAGSIGAWSEPFGMTWLTLDDVTLTLDYVDESNVTTVAGALASSFTAGGKAFSLSIGVEVSGGDFDLTFDAALDDTLTLDEMLQFIGIDTTGFPTDLKASSIGPISLSAEVAHRSAVNTVSVALGAAATISVGSASIDVDVLFALDDSADYRLGLRATSNLTLSSLVSGLPQGIDFGMPSFGIVLANAESTRASDTLRDQEFAFFGPLHGCAETDTPDDCSFDVELPAGLSVIANAPLPGSLADLADGIGMDSGAGVQLQGTIPLFGSGDIGLTVELPPWQPPGAPDWFKQGSLALSIGPTNLDIGGELVVRLPKADNSSTTCASDESACDILTFELTAGLELGPTFAFTLQGALKTDAPWEQAFGIPWLTVNQLVLQLGVEGPVPLFTMGFLGDVVIGDKDISISLSAGLTVTGVPIFKGIRAASAAGLELQDIVDLQNQIAPSSPISLGGGLPNIAVRNLEFMFAIEANPDLCLEAGLIIAGDLFIDPTSPVGADPSGPCSVTPATPDASTACLAAPDCFASVRLSVTDDGLIANGQLSAFDLGPIAFDDALVDLTLTSSDQHLMLSGGISISGFASGTLELTIGSTEFSFGGEVQIFDAFFAQLEGTATLDTPPGVHVMGIIRQELISAINEALRPFFQDLGAVVTVVNGIIDELQDPTKSLDDVAQTILMAPADLQALGMSVPQWLLDATDGINDGLAAYSDLTGTEGPLSDLLDPILTGIDFEISPGVAGEIIPETCLGTWDGGDCWAIEPVPKKTYKIKIWPFGKKKITIPGIPGVPGIVVPETCIVVTVDGTCYAIPPLVLELPGLCDIQAIDNALTPCNSTGLKAAIVDLFEAGFEDIVGVTVNDVQAEIQAIADAVSLPNLVIVDAPCIGFELDLGTEDPGAFLLDFHLVVFNQNIYFTDIGWDFGQSVAQNASGLQERLIKVLLGIETGNQNGNLCDGVAGGGSSTPVASIVPPSNVVITPSAGSVSEGSQVTLSGTFTEGTTSGSDTVTAMITWGDGQTSTVTPSGGSFTATHTYVDDNPTGTASDVYAITATVTNSSTGSATGSTAVTVTNVAPSLDTMQLSAGTIVEGDTVTLSGTYSDAGTADTHMLAITWGDGSSKTVAVSGGTFSITKTYADDIPSGTPADTYTVTATLKDDDLATDSSTTSITVNNAAPTVAVAATSTSVNEGDTVVLDGTIVDAGVLDLHTVTIDWGDGTPSDTFSPTVGVRTFVKTHTYRDDDPTATPSDDYTITVNIVDDDTGFDTTTEVVTVANVAPSNVTLQFGGIVLSEGDETGVFLSFTDPGIDDVHTVTVDWGDNSASSTVELDVGIRQTLLIHVYEDDNPTGTPQDDYPISVTITDDDGATVTQGVAEVYDEDTDSYVTGVPVATISNVAPAFEPLQLTASIDENGTATLSGTFVDPGLLDTFEMVIDWGDGTPTDTLLLDATDRRPPDPDLTEEENADLVTLVDFGHTHQYLDDNPTGTAADDYMVTVTVTDDDTGTDTATASITVNDVAPVVDAAPDSQSPQYSDPLTSVITLTAYDVAGYDGPTETLTAATEWQYEGGGYQAGLPEALAMASNGCVDGGEPGSVEPRQTCTWTVTGIVDVAPGVYDIRFTVTDDDGLASTTVVSVDVQPENARAYYTGPTFAATTSATDGSADIELRATVRDITAEDAGEPDWDVYPGDITNAIVDFIDRNTNAVLCTASVSPIFAGDVSVGTAVCDWHVDLGTADAEVYDIGIVVRGWYTRNETDDDAVVTVAKPLDQFITGGGYIDFDTENESAGVYAADDDTHANFGFNVKFNKKGTNLQGRATVTVRSDGRVYRIKTNNLQSLGIIEFPGEPNQAEFEAKANLVDVTDEDNPVDIGGNLTFQMRMSDFGEPNDSDTIGWTLYDKNGTLLFSSNWTGVDTAERVAKGNLVVHA